MTKDFYVSGQFNIDVKSSQSDKYVSPDDAQFLGENDPAKRGLYGLGTGKAFNYDGKIVLNYGRNIGQEGSGFVINAGSDIQHTNAHDLLHHGDGFPEGQPLGHQIRPGIRLLEPPERNRDAAGKGRLLRQRQHLLPEPVLRRRFLPHVGIVGLRQGERSAWDGTSTRRSSSKTSNGST